MPFTCKHVDMLTAMRLFRRREKGETTTNTLFSRF